ncbi:MAG: DMT family transporter [Lachnospiraceae bacterium]
MKQTIKGHGAALLSVMIWGTTFISSKIVLAHLSPIELLIYRFLVGLVVLTLLNPHKMVLKKKSDEIYFIFAGVAGVTLYYLLENISLTYTTASNAGVIVSTAPFFTALAAWLLRKERCMSVRFLAGFVLALFGIVLISFQGGNVSLNPLGDFLALCAAFVWGFYSVFSKWITEKGYPVISATRRIITWGLFFMIPFGFIMGFSFEPDILSMSQVLIHVIYLGISASAMCFVLWNYAVDRLGVITSGVYIYLTPVVTVALSIPVLHETFTWYTGAGMLLTIVGLVISG